MQWFVDHWDLLVLLGVNLLAVAAVAVKLTPSTTDDEWLAKFEEIFKNFNKPKA
jgi:hypothetical protein